MKSTRAKFHTVDQAFAKISRLKGPVLYAFDFDGTLVGHRRKHGQIKLPETMRKTLERLGTKGPVAVITGRSLENIAQKTGGLKIHLSGNHGFEIQLLGGKLIGTGKPEWEKATKTWGEATLAYMEKHPELKDCHLELKRYSLSLHFRSSKNPIAAQALYTKLISQMKPAPRILDGRLVVNVVPKKAFDKGDSLKVMMKALKCRSAIFAGDDITDEDVFRRKFPKVLSIRIGGDNRKVPAEIHFKTRGELAKLLKRLAQTAR